MFNKNLFPIHKKWTKLVFYKPVYCELSTLNISKTFMNDLNCNYIKEKYRDCVKLLFTDTNSLAHEILQGCK